MNAWLDDGDLRLYHGDVCDVLRSLPAGVAQTCVTSPPYWGLRDYGTEGQLGLEATPELYVGRMVAVFREVWRVLRDDGSLWLNLGDSYAASGPAGGAGKQHTNVGSVNVPVRLAPRGMKPKDLVGIPWRVAFALQADGWYLRSDIVWSKPNPMPESVTDRPTKAHEYVFLLSKRPRYFYDADAVREQSISDHPSGNGYARPEQISRGGRGQAKGWTLEDGLNGRNLRSVWQVATEPFPEAHFATYPQALVRPCILAGTSERGECAACGAPWVRVVEREGGRRSDEYRALPRTPKGRDEDEHGPLRQHANMASGLARPGWRTTPPEARSEQWAASCACDAPARPQTVLDPFAGSGTTLLVARNHARHAIGIDLAEPYLQIAARRLSQLSLLGSVSDA